MKSKIDSEKIHKVELENNYKTNTKHNGIISFWKFMFSIMIIVFHLGSKTNYENAILKSGYIGVEFFFIVSGYFMARTAVNVKEDCQNIGEETYKYLLNKIKKFFPYMVTAFFSALFIYIYFNIFNSKNEIVNSIWNLFFLEASGVKTTLVIEPAWYLSAMLISMLILYPLIRRYRKNFIYLIAPAIVIFIGGWISYNCDGVLSKWQFYTGIAYKGLLRAFFELSLGAILYEISLKVKNINFNKLGKIFLTLIEVLGFISVFIIANSGSSRYDFFELMLLSISVIIAFTEKTYFYNVASNKLFYYLENLSFPIYLNHLWIIDLIQIKLGYLGYWKKLAVILFSTIIFSIFIMYVIEKIKGKPTKIAKQIFIK